MRKIIVFLVLLVSVPVIFSCGYQLPKALEVHGTADFRFSAKKDIGDTFADMVPDIGSEYQLIKCINTVTRTYIIRGELLEESYVLEDNIPNVDLNFPIEEDKVIGERDLTISVNFDSVLSGFSLKPVIASVFIYGDSDNQRLIDILAVKIDIEPTNDEHDEYKKEYTRINKSRSGITDSLNNNNECSLTSLPGLSNAFIVLPLSKDDIKIDFKVYVPEGSTINPTWFGGKIFTEILVWVPLEFVAGENEDDDEDNVTRITIPPGLLFSEGQDLFGRSSSEAANPVGDYIESLELSIMLNQNPFEHRNLIIWSGPDSDYKNRNIEIHNMLKGKAFSFPIDEERMAEINNPDKYPFVPNFRIEYEPGEELKIPWEIKSTEFVFKAKIKYRTEF